MYVVILPPACQTNGVHCYWDPSSHLFYFELE